jgi:hypothetical protein
MSLSCECCVLSGRGLCEGLLTGPEESYPVWCVWVWYRNVDKEEAVEAWKVNCFFNEWLLSKLFPQVQPVKSNRPTLFFAAEQPLRRTRHLGKCQNMGQFGLSPWYRWDLRSSGMLRSVEWQFCTDVSGHPMGPNFKGQEVQENFHSTLRNIPEERRYKVPE